MKKVLVIVAVLMLMLPVGAYADDQCYGGSCGGGFYGTPVVGQQQQQQQGQGQQQAIGNSGTISNQQYTSAKGPMSNDANVQANMNFYGGQRAFPIPGQTTYAPMPQEFGNGSVDGNVQDLAIWCKYLPSPIDRTTAAKMDNGSVRIQGACLTEKREKDEPKDAVEILLSQPKDKKLALVGTVVGATKDGKSLTQDVLGKMALEAMSMKGAKYLVLIAQGTQKVTQTWGFGIALGYTHAMISDDGQKAGTGTIGIGFSMGEAGRKSNPWIQAVVLGDEESMKEVTTTATK